jgi:hypothetical protein
MWSSAHIIAFVMQAQNVHTSKTNGFASSSESMSVNHGKTELECDGVLAHVDTAIDNILDPLQLEFEALQGHSPSKQSNILQCAWHMLHPSRGLLVRRSHLSGANVRSRLRSLLTATAQYAASFEEPQKPWSWDFRTDPRHIGASNSATSQSVAMATAELLSDLLAASTIAARCA